MEFQKNPISAVGPGCPDIEVRNNTSLSYRMEQETLYADISCPPGFVFSDTAKSSKIVKCIHDFSSTDYEWSDKVMPCIGKWNLQKRRKQLRIVKEKKNAMNRSQPAHPLWKSFCSKSNKSGKLSANNSFLNILVVLRQWHEIKIILWMFEQFLCQPVSILCTNR